MSPRGALASLVRLSWITRLGGACQMTLNPGAQADREFATAVTDGAVFVRLCNAATGEELARHVATEGKANGR